MAPDRRTPASHQPVETSTTCMPLARSTASEVGCEAARPHGTISSKNRRSVVTFNAIPCIEIPLRIRTPKAQELSRSGALFVFFGKRRDALKVLFFDGSGMCVFYKRLDRGTFRIPEPQTAEAKHVEMDDAALEALLDGIDVDATRPPKRRADRIH